MTPSDSFEGLMARLQAGDESAAAAIFQRFASQLIDLARAHLPVAARTKVDPEDVLQSVFRSFFQRQRAGQFALSDWEGLWGLLVVITLRKCRNQAAYFTAGRRDVAREVSLALGEGVAVEVTALARDPTPSEATALSDLLAELFRGLHERDRPVLTFHLQGYTAEEISRQIQRTVRTVRRSLERIRARLHGLYDNGSGVPS